MLKLMKLKGKISSGDKGWYVFHGTLYDNTVFSVSVREHDVFLNESLDRNSSVDGWLYVEEQSRQGNRVSVQLPQPSIQYGRNISVHEYILMPRSTSIEDFKN
jgi:hypothetical protein